MDVVLHPVLINGASELLKDYQMVEEADLDFGEYQIAEKEFFITSSTTKSEEVHNKSFQFIAYLLHNFYIMYKQVPN